jgi:RimJ/RimL family protein N-acetyltransferase
LAVLKDKEFIGMIGLVDISLENRNAEISIVIDPKKRRKGYGKEALTLLLEYGFNQLNLDNIFGESYLLNPFLDFWYCMIETFNGSDAILKNRKFYNGRYWDSLYFNFNKSDYYKL